MIKTTGIDLQCDSCYGTILAGEKFRSVRIRKQKAHTRQHAQIIKNSLPRHTARHLNCPEPALQVDCPKCFASINQPCIIVNPLTIDVDRIRKPHNARRLKLANKRK